MNTEILPRGFGFGFVTALALVFVLGVANSAARWASSHELPQAAVRTFTKPMFSLADLLQLGLLLFLGLVIAWTLAYGPRIR